MNKFQQNFQDFQDFQDFVNIILLKTILLMAVVERGHFNVSSKIKTKSLKIMECYATEYMIVPSIRIKVYLRLSLLSNKFIHSFDS